MERPAGVAERVAQFGRAGGGHLGRASLAVKRAEIEP
jgi:hypothetical protein